MNCEYSPVRTSPLASGMCFIRQLNLINAGFNVSDYCHRVYELRNRFLFLGFLIEVTLTSRARFRLTCRYKIPL